MIKTALLVDGSNIYAACRAINLEIDYARLLQMCSVNKVMVTANYYSAVLERRENESDTLRPLLDWLEYNDYSVITKTCKVFTDERGLTKVKGNMDTEIIVDMMMLAKHVDHFYLCSGDGDFTYAVETVQRFFGCRVTVISTLCKNRIGYTSMVADELRRTANSFIDMDMARSLLVKHD